MAYKSIILDMPVRKVFFESLFTITYCLLVGISGFQCQNEWG